jgi:hypothetical protein
MKSRRKEKEEKNMSASRKNSQLNEMKNDIEACTNARFSEENYAKYQNFANLCTVRGNTYAGSPVVSESSLDDVAQLHVNGKSADERKLEAHAQPSLPNSSKLRCYDNNL